MNPEKRYFRRFLAAVLGYVILLLIADLLLNRIPAGSVWRYAVSPLPVVPVAFGVLAFLTYVRRLDELQRRIQLEALAFSLGCTGLLTLTLGFLENGGLPRVSMIWVLPMIIGLWGVGVYIAGRRFR